MSNASSCDQNLLLGFQYARDHPDTTKEQFETELNDLAKQIEALPTWKLRLLSGEGTWIDHIRLKLLSKGDTNEQKSE